MTRQVEVEIARELLPFEEMTKLSETAETSINDVIASF